MFFFNKDLCPGHNIMFPIWFLCKRSKVITKAHSFSSLIPINFIFAQAGITTTLNSRCSVLAAANSVYGRWDETKGEENIDFMPTILSRFDMIFIVKDTHNEARDTVRIMIYVR